MKLDFKHLLDWSILSVSEPVAVVKKQQMQGYKFVVNYIYHGSQTLFFEEGAPKWVMNYGDARCAARSRYMQFRDKMYKQKNNNKR